VSTYLVKKQDWDLNNSKVLIVAASWRESIAIKHRVYICENKRNFQSSHYIGFYKNGRIKYIYEILDAPYYNSTLGKTPVLRTLDDSTGEKNHVR
jgi:hypothetical protein